MFPDEFPFLIFIACPEKNFRQDQRSLVEKFFHKVLFLFGVDFHHISSFLFTPSLGQFFRSVVIDEFVTRVFVTCLLWWISSAHKCPCLTFSRRSLPVSTSSRVLCLRPRISHWNVRPNPCTWDLRNTQNQPIGTNQWAPKVRKKLNLSLSIIGEKLAYI